jgi:A/G-specific adenine glycosylase
LKEASKNWFSTGLLKWNREQNNRQMPWKGEKDQYKIWLSEIILQQTRVDQGLGYYKRFIQAFPDIHQLACASDKSIFKLWEGLGYYTRCRNLIATARHLSREKGGRFPDSYEDILALKGVGPYTASAIASFAFNLPHAVVDGNVFRVLARISGNHLAVDSAAGKRSFSVMAEKLLDKKNPGQYNQAIMDFGAIVCKPVNPLCGDCIFKKRCTAFLRNEVEVLPVKEKKIAIRKRWFYYFIAEYGRHVLIRQRTGKDIWRELYEFPLIESTKEIGEKTIIRLAIRKGLISKENFQLISVSSLSRQQLTHQLINGRFFRVKLDAKSTPTENGSWIRKTAIKQYSFPRIINHYLQQNEDNAV